MNQDNLKLLANDSNSFLEFIESAVLSDCCIQYWHDGCGTCGCFQLKEALNRYSDVDIIAGLKQLPYSKFRKPLGSRHQMRFEDAVGMCLEKIWEQSSQKALRSFFEGTPVWDFFRYQKQSNPFRINQQQEKEIEREAQQEIKKMQEWLEMPRKERIQKDKKRYKEKISQENNSKGL